MASETQSGELTDTLIAKLAPAISDANMEIIALMYLKFKNEDITKIRTKCGKDALKFNMEILTEWRNKNKSKENVAVQVCFKHTGDKPEILFHMHHSPNFISITCLDFIRRICSLYFSSMCPQKFYTFYR